MKLYATVTSERASKGQGGNKYLHIHVTNEDGISVINLNLDPYDEYTAIVDGFIAGKKINCDVPIKGVTKGKKQKGECVHEWRYYDSESRECTKCRKLHL